MTPELDGRDDRPPGGTDSEATTPTGEGRPATGGSPATDRDRSRAARGEPFEETARKVLRKCLDAGPGEVRPRECTLGERFPLLGEARTVVTAESRSAPTVTGDCLVLPADHHGATDLRTPLRDLYRRAGTRYFAGRVVEYADRLGVSPVPVGGFESPTRLVDCSADPPVRFNWRAVMAPPEVVDHAAVHALAHLRRPAPDHTRAFRAFVREHRPAFGDDGRYADWLDPLGIALRLPP